MTVFGMKLLIILCMFLDHFMAVFGSYGFGIIPYEYYNAGRTVARLVFPLVCFLIVNGYQHTRDQKQYLNRLIQFAVLAQLPFSLVFYSGNFNLSQTDTFLRLTADAWKGLPLLCLVVLCIWRYFKGHDRQMAMIWAVLTVILRFVQLRVAGVTLLSGDKLSVFYTLAVGLFGIICFETIKWRKGLLADRLLLVATWLACFVLFGSYSDYGYLGMTLIVLLYLCRKSKALQCICLVWFAFETYFTTFQSMGYFLAASIPAVLVLLYNGELGRYKMKLFFYWFYPAHLLLLGLCSVAYRFLII